jgi:hypothetical protein
MIVIINILTPLTYCYLFRDPVIFGSTYIIYFTIYKFRSQPKILQDIDKV